MSRKPRFKVQRRNTYVAFDLNHGRKQWLNVYDNSMRLGFTLTFAEATDLYWQMQDDFPANYRIVEKR